MSQKDIQKESVAAPNTPSGNESVSREETPVFYRMCPECGEDTLELSDLDVFFRPEFLGVTHENEFGCGHMELDGDYDWEIECSSCGYSVFDMEEVTVDSLLEWAAAHGQAVRNLTLACPVCGSGHLDKVEAGLERSRLVRAVYETWEKTETEAHLEVALSFERGTEGGESVRYRCLRGHELANDDGSPVGSVRELVEWLKTHQTSNQA